MIPAARVPGRPVRTACHAGLGENRPGAPRFGVSGLVSKSKQCSSPIPQAGRCRSVGFRLVTPLAGAADERLDVRKYCEAGANDFSSLGAAITDRLPQASGHRDRSRAGRPTGSSRSPLRGSDRNRSGAGPSVRPSRRIPGPRPSGAAPPLRFAARSPRALLGRVDPQGVTSARTALKMLQQLIRG